MFKNKYGFLSFYQKVLLALAGTVYGASCQGFLEATLEPFLADQVKEKTTKSPLNEPSYS